MSRSLVARGNGLGGDGGEYQGRGVFKGEWGATVGVRFWLVGLLRLVVCWGYLFVVVVGVLVGVVFVRGVWKILGPDRNCILENFCWVTYHKGYNYNQ